MYLNAFAQSLEPLDLSQSDEAESLLASAADLGLTIGHPPRYCSRNHLVRGLRLHYLEWGASDSPAILLLHGGNQSAHSWDLVSLVLSKHFRVIALDQRGHGDSEWPRDGDSSIPAMVEDVAQFSAALGVDRLTVIGHSMGGLVTLHLMLEHPELVERAVLVDIAPEVSREGAKTIRGFIANNWEFDSVDEFVEAVLRHDALRPEAHVRRTARYNLHKRADGKFISKHQRRLASSTASQALVTLDRAGEVSCPVLLVRGDQSQILSPEAAQRFVDALPQAELATVPDAGHNVHGQNTLGFLDAVLPFLLGSLEDGDSASESGRGASRDVRSSP